MTDPYSQFDAPAQTGTEDPYAQFDAPNGGVPSGSSLPSPSPGGAPPPDLLGALSGAARTFGNAMNLPNRIIGEGIERVSGVAPSSVAAPKAAENPYPFWSDVFLNPGGASLSQYAGHGAADQLTGYKAPTSLPEKVAAGVVQGGADFATQALTDPTTWMFGAGKAAQLANKVNAALGVSLAAGAAPDVVNSLGEVKKRLDAGDTSPETFQAATQALLGAGVIGVGALSAAGHLRGVKGEEAGMARHAPEASPEAKPTAPEAPNTAGSEAKLLEGVGGDSTAQLPTEDFGFSEEAKAAIEPRLLAAYKLERRIEPVRSALNAQKLRESHLASQGTEGYGGLVASENALKTGNLTLDGTPVNEMPLSNAELRLPDQNTPDIAVPKGTELNTPSEPFTAESEPLKLVRKALPPLSDEMPMTQAMRDEISAGAISFGNMRRASQLRLATRKLIDNQRLEPEEINLIKEATGIKLTDWERSKAGRVVGGVMGALKLAWNVPRTMVLGMDNSWWWRQGFVPVMSSWLDFVPGQGTGRLKALKTAFVNHMKATGPEGYRRIQDEFFKSPDIQAAERVGVMFHEHGERTFQHGPEDVFLGGKELSDVLKKVEQKNIHGVSQVAKVVRVAEETGQRWFNVAANQERGAYFTRLRNLAGISAQDILTGALTPEQWAHVKASASAANVLTGRGDTGMGVLNFTPGRGTRALKSAMGPLANWFTSPSFALARAQMLDPTYYAKLKQLSPMVAKDTAVATSAALGTVAATIALAGAAVGGAVSWDPEDVDFGKVRKGKVRYDVAGGTLPYLRTLFSTAKALTHAAGLTDEPMKTSLAGVKRPAPLGETWSNFVGNKVHPSARFLYKHVAGNAYPEDTSLGGFARDITNPAFFQDVYDVATEDGALGPLLAATVVSGIGGGVGVYAAPREHTPDEQKLIDEYNANQGEARDSGKAARDAVRLAAQAKAGDRILPSRGFDILKAIKKQRETRSESPYITRIANALASGDRQSAYAIEMEARRKGISGATVAEVEKEQERLLQ